MSKKYGVQGDESEVDGRNFNQGNKDISNDRNSEESFNLDEDESTRDNNGDKNDEEKFRQINSKVIVSQKLECDGEEEGVNKDETVILEQTQDITNNTQSGSIHKTVETHRTSTRNKKTPSIRGNDFFMVNKVYSLENDTNTNKLTNSKNLFKIFHQNIRGLKSKVDELSNSLFPDYPNIMCLTEHHLKDYEIDNLPIHQFKLGSKFCIHKFKNGGVCILVHEDLDFFSISLDKYCKEKDIEVCAVRLKITPIQFIILAIYRSPSGNFTNFLKNRDSILNTWYNNKIKFVICGDININYLENCKKRQQLDALLQTYNLIGTVSYPTRESKTSTAATDNICITRTKNYIINPHVNGLSDHVAQIIMIENTVLTKQIDNITTKRDINDQSILEFQLLLSHENWEEIFMEDDANRMMLTG